MFNFFVAAIIALPVTVGVYYVMYVATGGQWNFLINAGFSIFFGSFVMDVVWGWLDPKNHGIDSTINMPVLGVFLMTLLYFFSGTIAFVWIIALIYHGERGEVGMLGLNLFVGGGLLLGMRKLGLDQLYIHPMSFDGSTIIKLFMKAPPPPPPYTPPPPPPPPNIPPGARPLGGA